jgi:hypothetical protein
MEYDYIKHPFTNTVFVNRDKMVLEFYKLLVTNPNMNESQKKLINGIIGDLSSLGR